MGGSQVRDAGWQRGTVADTAFQKQRDNELQSEKKDQGWRGISGSAANVW